MKTQMTTIKKAEITRGSRNDMAAAKPAHGDTPGNIT
jgi:hypothetical protein